MKNSVKTNKLVVILLFIGLGIFVSCTKDESEIKNEVETSNQFNGGSGNSAKCVLTNDGCVFTSGCGTDFDNKSLMVSFLNCQTESLGSGCSWASGFTNVDIIYEVSINNCIYTASQLNGRVNLWRQAAVNLRPNSSYLITNFQNMNGYMQTQYGPYMQRIKVTFRKKICQAIINPTK